MLLPAFGPEGQERLGRSHVVIVGCGALGCAGADLLARAGIGRLTLVDRDVVEITNLQRQTLFSEADTADGMPKAEAARRRLTAVNSTITIEAVVADVNPSNAESLIGRPTLIFDGCDNFETRYLLNDVAVKYGVPYVYGGAVGTRGMQATIVPGRTPCLRCLFDEPPPPGTTPTCDTVGVLGPIIAITAAWQATEALKVLLGEPTATTLLDVDAWTGATRRLDLGQARGDCPCCGTRRFEFLSGARAGGGASLCGQDAVQVAPASSGNGQRVELEALAARLASHGSFKALGRLLIRGVFEHERGDQGRPIELTVFADGRAIVKGTTRPEAARSIYAKYVGG
jgi:adenylyltransferase/sulfurtransferase